MSDEKSPELVEAPVMLNFAGWIETPCPYCGKPFTREDVKVVRVVNVSPRVLAHDDCYRAAHPEFDAVRVSEHDFQQEFVEMFKREAAGYPQPVADYPLGDGKRFDLAWPEQHVAVGLASGSIILTTNEWTVLAFTPQHWAADSQDIIKRVRRALDA